MNRKLAASLAIAGVLSLASCAESGPPRTAAGPAVTRDEPAFDTRHQVDPLRRRVWWLTRDGVIVHEASNPQRLGVALPGWQWAGAPHGHFPDLALDPDGAAVVTSDVVATLWRIDPVTLAVSVHSPSLEADEQKDVGFSAIVYSHEHGAFFGVSGIHGTLWMIDRSLARARKVALSSPVRAASRIALAAPKTLADGRRLCVQGPRNDWIVELLPGRPAAAVRDAPCVGLPTSVASR